MVREPDHILIENVAVDPSRQGEGIGRTLLAFAEVYARKSRINTLRLYTNAAMTENLALYLRLDYREVDPPQREWVRACLLRKAHRPRMEACAFLGVVSPTSGSQHSAK